MRKIISVLCLSLFGNLSVLSAFCLSDCAPDPWPSQNYYEIDLGYRRDKLQWTLPGNRVFDSRGRARHSPNILSELTWKDIESIQIAGSGRYVSCRNYAIKVSGDYGHIYHGENTDADYNGDHRTQLYSYSLNNAGKGCVYDLSAGAGYRLTSRGERCIITPYLGYSYHAQNLHMYDGYQRVAIDRDTGEPLPTGHIKGLNSSYKAHWFGPWLGLDFVVQVERCAYLFGAAEWHWVKFSGNGHWNLRKDISPFDQSAYGQGLIATLGANWEIWRNWSIGIVANYRNFRTGHGTEKITVYEPIEDSGNFQWRVNKITWVSGDISGLVSVRF